MGKGTAGDEGCNPPKCKCGDSHDEFHEEDNSDGRGFSIHKFIPMQCERCDKKLMLFLPSYDLEREYCCEKHCIHHEWEFMTDTGPFMCIYCGINKIVYLEAKIKRLEERLEIDSHITKFLRCKILGIDVELRDGIPLGHYDCYDCGEVIHGTFEDYKKHCENEHDHDVIFSASNESLESHNLCNEKKLHFKGIEGFCPYCGWGALTGSDDIFFPPDEIIR